MKKEIREFRCIVDGSLFSKCTVESICESKCRKCKNFMYFNQGTVCIVDINNNFEGDE